MNKKTRKKLAFGLVTLLLAGIGILFSFTFGDINYGDVILNNIGLRPWSKGDSGTHYTIYYSLIFFIPSVILGYKYKDNIWAKIGRGISIIMIVLISFGLLFTASKVWKV